MLNRIKSSIVKAIASLGLLSLTSCGEPSVEYAETGEELSNNEQCNTLPPDFIFPGGGRVRTSATYDHDACADGYLIDLRDYSPKNTEGTRVTYAGTTPTTKEACEVTSVRAYVWRRNANGTTTYLGQKSRNGVWLTDAPSGAGRCGVASVLLERDISGFAPGATYRLAVRAQTNPPYARKEVFVETQSPPVSLSPAQQLTILATMLQNLQRLAPGIVHNPIINTIGIPHGGIAMQCRLLGLELSAMGVMEPSFVRAGATASTVSARTTTLDSLYQGYCVQGGVSLLTLQQRIQAHLQTLVDMRDQIATSTGATPNEAAEIMSELWDYELTRIRTGCGTVLSEGLAFLETGALPVGMTGPNVLFRNCSGTQSATRTALGLSAGPASIASTLRSCIVNAFNGPREPIKDTCSTDPRATGTPPPSQGQADEECRHTRFDGLCITKIVGRDDPEAREFVNRTTRLESAYFEATTQVRLAEQRVAQLTLSSAQRAADGNKLGVASAAVSLIGELAVQVHDEPWVREVVDFTARALSTLGSLARAEGAIDGLQGTITEIYELPAAVAKETKTRELMCREDPNSPFCNPVDEPQQRCAEWELSSGPVWFDNGATSGPLTMADRIEACTCEAIDAVSGAITGGKNIVCQAESQRRKHQCYGDLRSMPNPETCWDFFQPGELDRDALRIDMCATVLCAAGTTPTVINGVCNCLEAPLTSSELATRCNFTGSAGAVTCDASSGLVCDALGARCVGFDAGRKPFATRGCRTPSGIQLGSRNEYGFFDPRDVFTATFPSRPELGGDDFLVMRRGFVPFTGPEKDPDEYTSIGSTARVAVLAPNVLPTGDRGSLQVLCSNPGANVFNRFCGQKEFTSLVAGRENILDFPLDSSCLTGCVLAGDTPYRLSYGFRTPMTQTQPSAFGGVEWGGVFTPRTNPFPDCSPTPDPSTPPDPGRTLTLLRTGVVAPSPIEGVFLAPWTYALQSGTGSGMTYQLIR